MTITSKNLSEISTLGEIMEDCYKKVACPSCGVMKRSNNLTRHLKDPKGHAMTHEQALELRNSLKHGQSHEPDMVKKRRIETLPTKSPMVDMSVIIQDFFFNVYMAFEIELKSSKSWKITWRRQLNLSTMTLADFLKLY